MKKESSSDKSIAFSFIPHNAKLTILLFFIAVTNANAQATLFEDFESYSVGQRPIPPWSFSGNLDIQVDNTKAFSGNQSVRMFGIVGSCWGALLHQNLNSSPPFIIQFNVYNGIENLSGCHPSRAVMQLNTGPSWASSLRTLLGFEEDGTLKGCSPSNIVNQLTGRTIGHYSLDGWMSVRVLYERIDTSTVGVTYWVNNEYKGRDVLPAFPYEDDLIYLTPQAAEGTVWFDDIVVYPYEPAINNVPALSLSGILLLSAALGGLVVVSSRERRWKMTTRS